MTVRIAVDAMGGDHAPGEIVAGAAAAAQALDITVTLFGEEAALRREIAQHAVPHNNVAIVGTTETIAFDEAPVQAVRQKKDSSLVRGLLTVKAGDADAFVSAGSTGALLAGGLLLLGRLPGIDRPALATPMPTLRGVCLVLDVGANADNTAEHLLQFAQMGSVYAEHVWRAEHPRVALLNNGTEDAKGSPLTKTAHALLQRSGLNYVGYIEARDVFSGNADVIVTDGFTGNVFLKATEGVSQTIMSLLKAELTANAWRQAAALVLKGGLKQVGRRLDYSEYGGAPFLGVRAPVIKCHGSSKARAIASGIRVAHDFVAGRCLEHMAQAGQA